MRTNETQKISKTQTFHDRLKNLLLTRIHTSQDDHTADCSRCDYRFYEHTVGREYITLLCDCGTICKTCLTEKERGQTGRMGRGRLGY